MYENGKYPIPYDVAVKLADVLEIEVSLLYDDFSRFLAMPYTEALKSVRTSLGLSQKAFAEQIGLYPVTTISSKEAIADRHERFIRRYALCSKPPVYKLRFYGSIYYNEGERQNNWRSDLWHRIWLIPVAVIFLSLIFSWTTQVIKCLESTAGCAGVSCEKQSNTLDDMILTEILFPHLWEIDETTHRRVKQIITDFLKKDSAPDKAT